jgi:hypothetical protein
MAVYDRKAVKAKNRQTERRWLACCRLAEMAFRGIEQEKYSIHLAHASVHDRPLILQLKQWLAKYGLTESIRLRCESYRKGLLSKIFDPNAHRVL